MQQPEDTHVTVLYDFEYTATNGRKVNINKGEKLYLINKTNQDWWQVIRSCEERPFYVPAAHVCEPKRGPETVDYQNLESASDQLPKKPVPKTRTKLQSRLIDKDNDSDSSHGSSDRSDNRMKNSYNLKSDSMKIERKQSVPASRRKPLEVSKKLSQSLEKLAQEIKFEPRVRGDSSPKENNPDGIILANHSQDTTQSLSKEKSEKEAKNHQNKAARTEKTEDKGFFRASLRGKTRDADLIQHNTEVGKKNNMRGKSSDASIVLNERKPVVTKSRGLFSSFKRKKPAFVISSSWEGLDKISEIEDKPMITPYGLQRSKTFMTPERPKPRTRLDAYKDPGWTVSTFKPQVEEKKLPERPSLAPFATRKASLVRNRRVDSTKSRVRVPATPPPDETPVRELGDGWGEFQSSDGRPYFYNRLTGERNLKPPRKISNLHISGSKDSICSDLSSPVRSSPSPKFSSGTSLDRLTPPKYSSRQSLDRLTPIEMPPLTEIGPGTPPYPSAKPPLDPEDIELHDRLCDIVPDGWSEFGDTQKDTGKTRRMFIHIASKQKYSTWPGVVEKKLEIGNSLPSVFADSQKLADGCNYYERKDVLEEWVRSDEPVSRDLLLPPTYQDVFKKLLEVMKAEIAEIDEMMSKHEPDTVTSHLLHQFVNTVTIECGLSPKIDGIFDDGRKKEKPPVPPRRRKKDVDFPEEDLVLLERASESTKVKRKPSFKRKASQEQFVQREDVIIEWADHLDSLNEPVVLEGKGIPVKCSSESSDGLSEEWAHLSDSDEGEVEMRSNSWHHSRDRPLCDDDLKNWCSTASFDGDSDHDELRARDPNRPRVVSYSITIHMTKSDNLSSNGLSKSLDYFNDLLTEQRVSLKVPDNSETLPSVEAWLGYIRLAPYEEADFDEWFAAHDDEGRVYFYRENSAVSSWQLPVLPDPQKDTAERAVNGEMYCLQRSATDTAIPSDEPRFRRTTFKEDAKGRASKTQSMILDGKLDVASAVGKTGAPALTELVDIIKSGSLNRARIMEHGKRIRKNWVSTFSVLCKSLIFFFKDEKTYRQMLKNLPVPKGTAISHSLAGAEIEPVSNSSLSGRKHVYKISWPLTEILVHAEKKADAELWFQEISSAINDIPKPRKDSSDSIGKSSPNKISREKSIKTKTKGSNEDLNSGGNKSRIGEILKKLIARRPSSEVLRQKGILKDEPCFGCSLEQITTNRKLTVPEFVVRCVSVIESSEENMKTDGLYRASGNLSQMQKIRVNVDQNNFDVLEREEDVHVLTGSLKLFLRELKEPLIPKGLTEEAIDASRNNNEEKLVKELKKIMEKLSAPNNATLRHLLEHLLRVEKYKEFNRMNFSNLAIVFGPTLMYSAEENPYMAIQMQSNNVVIDALLKHYYEIFS